MCINMLLRYNCLSMALEMTHLRFAAEVAPKLCVTDMSLYLAGSVYPDSRYVTGVARNLTHGENAPNDPFDPNLDDFRKGWATHDFYDHHASEKYKALSPWPQNIITAFSQEWIFITAEKIVEDLISYDTGIVAIDIINGMAMPSPINQEDPTLLAKYFHDIRSLYANRPTIEDYRHVLLGWKIQSDVIDALLAKAQEFLMDSDMKHRIANIYTSIADEFIIKQT